LNFFKSINLHKLIKIKLQNLTTGCCYLSQTKAEVIQYTNCIVKANKMETVKLTLFKYKSWWQSCPLQNKHPPLLTTVVYNRLEMRRLVILVMLTSRNFNRILID